MDITVKARLVAKRSELYSKYVFLDLIKNEFFTCVVLPNWDEPEIQLNDIGYITFEKAVAGDQYYDRRTDSECIYKYNRLYFKTFVKENNNNEIEII